MTADDYYAAVESALAEMTEDAGFPAWQAQRLMRGSTSGELLRAIRAREQERLRFWADVWEPAVREALALFEREQQEMRRRGDLR